MFSPPRVQENVCPSPLPIPCEKMLDPPRPCKKIGVTPQPPTPYILKFHCHCDQGISLFVYPHVTWCFELSPFLGFFLHPNNTANDQPLQWGFLMTSYRIHIPQCHSSSTAASIEMFFQLPPPPHQSTYICFYVYIVYEKRCLMATNPVSIPFSNCSYKW